MRVEEGREDQFQATVHYGRRGYLEQYAAQTASHPQLRGRVTLV
jgi:hypothetical protein